MPDICKHAGTLRYTAHSLRSTALTAISDSGLSDRSIMLMSDQKCEQSLKSYCRRPSTAQKEIISNVLENVATGEYNLLLSWVPVYGNSAIPSTAGSSCAVMPSSTNNVLAMNQQSNQISSFATHSTFNIYHFHRQNTGPANGNPGS